MQIIKLNAIDSTNRYLRDLVSEIPLEDFAVVVAKYQIHVWTKNNYLEVEKDKIR